MYSHEIKVRVRYAETDQMGYVYYGRYAEYLEMARTHMIRSLGITYKDMEENDGVLLPVVELNIQYMKPAHYDDELTILTVMRDLPAVRITFESDIVRGVDLLARARVTLCFVDKATGRIGRCPDNLLEKLSPYFD